MRFFLLLMGFGGVLSYLHPVSVFLAMGIIALMTNMTVMWRTAISWKMFRE